MRGVVNPFQKIAITILFASVMLTVSAQGDTVSVTLVDSVPTAPLPQKRANWLVRAYRFCDRVLSPPRDSNYIDVQNYNWCAELQLTTRLEQYEIDGGDDFNVRFSPEPRTRIGPFFGWRWAFLGYNFDLKSIFINDDDTDLGGSVYSAAFGVDLFYRRVGGNYKMRSLSVAGHDYSDIVSGQSFDGIHIGMTRVSFYYILNYKRYSHQAAFSQTNRQLRSAGSPILGASYAHNRFSIDNERLSSFLKPMVGEMSSQQKVEAMNNDEFSFTGGYAYNWVFAKNWLAAGEITGSFGYLMHHTDVAEDDGGGSVFKRIDTFYRKNIAFNGNVRFAVLYNNGPWFAGMQGVFFYYQYGNGVMMTRNSLGSLYLYVGCNF